MKHLEIIQRLLTAVVSKSQTECGCSNINQYSYSNGFFLTFFAFYFQFAKKKMLSLSLFATAASSAAFYDSFLMHVRGVSARRHRKPLQTGEQQKFFVYSVCLPKIYTADRQTVTLYNSLLQILVVFVFVSFVCSKFRNSYVKV